MKIIKGKTPLFFNSFFLGGGWGGGCRGAPSPSVWSIRNLEDPEINAGFFKMIPDSAVEKRLRPIRKDSK